MTGGTGAGETLQAAAPAIHPTPEPHRRCGILRGYGAGEWLPRAAPEPGTHARTLTPPRPGRRVARPRLPLPLPAHLVRPAARGGRAFGALRHRDLRRVGRVARQPDGVGSGAHAAAEHRRGGRQPLFQEGHRRVAGGAAAVAGGARVGAARVGGGGAGRHADGRAAQRGGGGALLPDGVRAGLRQAHGDHRHAGFRRGDAALALRAHALQRGDRGVRPRAGVLRRGAVFSVIRAGARGKRKKEKGKRADRISHLQLPISAEPISNN